MTRGYSGVQVFNTLYAGREAGEPAHCGQAGGASYWLAYQAPANGSLTLDTDGSDFDTVLAVYTYDGALLGYQSLTSVACDDNSGANGLTSRLTFDTSAGRPYLIVVDGVNAARGTAHLNYHLVATPKVVSPSIVAPPASQTVIEGQAASFTVTATGTPPLEYQWLRNDAPIPGATTATLAIPAVTVADAGGYAVRVSNAAGTVTSAAATLEVVLKPAITQPPVSQSVPEGQAATFTVTATGTSPLEYQWLRNDAPIPGATTATLAIPAVTVADAGAYAVRVFNAAGAITSAAATLEVVLKPMITQPPVSQNVPEGQGATFTVTATGTSPLEYQWLRNDAPIPGATTATLAIPAVTVADAGAYAVRVSNAAGAITSAAFRVVVGTSARIVRPSAGGPWLIQLPTVPGLRYRLESTTAWPGAAWELLATGVADSDFVTVPLPADAVGLGNRFYRFVVPAFPESAVGAPRDP